MVDETAVKLIKCLERQQRQLDEVRGHFHWFMNKTALLIENLGLMPISEYERKGFLKCVFQDEMPYSDGKGGITHVKINNLPKNYIIGKHYWVSKDEAEKRRWWMRVS